MLWWDTGLHSVGIGMNGFRSAESGVPLGAVKSSVHGVYGNMLPTARGKEDIVIYLKMTAVWDSGRWHVTLIV